MLSLEGPMEGHSIACTRGSFTLLRHFGNESRFEGKRSHGFTRFLQKRQWLSKRQVFPNPETRFSIWSVYTLPVDLSLGLSDSPVGLWRVHAYFHVWACMGMCTCTPGAHISHCLNHTLLGMLKQALSGEPKAYQKVSLALQLVARTPVFVF